MTGPEPKSADLIATDPTTALPWEVVRDVLEDTRPYWLATVHPTGRPGPSPGAPRKTAELQRPLVTLEATTGR